MASVKLVLDSVNPFGNRLSTFEVELPKFLLAQLNTHRQLSRNAASSRAIPLARFRDLCDYTPKVWWKNGSGMSPSELLVDTGSLIGMAWDDARDEARHYHRKLGDMGVHKQQANRLLEPFAMVKVLVSATEWDNFLNLRLSAGAQDEMQDVAQQVGRLLLDATPAQIQWLDKHTPYVQFPESWLDCSISAARCARVSYLNHDGVADTLKDMILAERLEGDGHLSPFEHVAVAVPGSHANYKGWCSYRRFLLDETKVNDSWKGLIK